MDYAIGKKTINEPTRVNLLGNSIVLIAPKDSKIDNVTIAHGFDLARLAGDGRIATVTSRPCRSANMPRPRWRSSAHGPPPSRNSRWPKACAPR